ncbi:Altered inheritance of mitochondria protein 32 [Sesamum alatum]|uniref:Altered inheritance of mitochondria protein 32 n=1 Tax=Sesamum alatum TaxID=300844 RepID=A0AAE2CYV6_9LAMI|nr:Altered inheritance of mitochondria protein 32 [Sesamum alatum]
MSNPLMASNRDDPLLLLSSHHPSSASSPIAVSESDSYLLDASQIGSASGSFQNDGFLGGGYDSGLINEAEYGFSRPDFRQGPLVGTVELYERHVFLCYKNPQVWPPRIEAAEFDRLPRLLAAALAARKPDMKRQTRLTICEGRDGTETSNGDVLIFPDMIRYRRLTHFDVDTFVEEVLVKDGEWLPGSPEALRGWYIFVCCHGTRDRRCGVCGPSVISKFKNEIESRGLQGKVSVSPCSHIGGHKYAGNVIIFGPNMKKEVTGHWYGYVMPEDVPLLLEQHIGKGEIVDFLWRGQMGLSEEDQKKSQELRFQVNGGTTMDRSTKESARVNEGSAGTCASQVEGTGCCQVNGGFSCCQKSVSQEKRLDPDSTDIPANSTSGKNKSSKKQVSRNNSGKGTGPRKVCSMPTWYESWEREDTYTALAVISAAMSVAFAYRCYKQLS